MLSKYVFIINSMVLVNTLSRIHTHACVYVGVRGLTPKMSMTNAIDFRATLCDPQKEKNVLQVHLYGTVCNRPKTWASWLVALAIN